MCEMRLPRAAWTCGREYLSKYVKIIKGNSGWMGKHRRQQRGVEVVFITLLILVFSRIWFD
jgi:hypothetical protein